MSLRTEAWVTAARLRRKLRRGRPERSRLPADRLAWIAAHAAGRSFADVGGLFNDGANAFAAEDAGAAAVTLLDAGDRELMPGFEAEHARRASAIRFVQGDLHDPVTIERLGPHAVVWCTGVLYHTPDPLGQLRALREVTRELLYLGTHTIPEVPGVPQACLFYPYLEDGDRAALARAYANPRGGLGIGVPFDDRPMTGYGNFWWGITPSALRSMLRAARFEVVEEHRPHDHPWMLDVVARPIDKDPLLPPVDYYRRRREAREQGRVLPHEDFYDTEPWPGRLP